MTVGPPTQPIASPAIDGDRLLRRLDQLAAIGGHPEGGVTRLAYSPEDVDGRDLVASWMTEAGLEVSLDSACNLIGRAVGTNQELPPIVLGSHIDTVVNGGHLDGAYGVVAAVEVAHALVASQPGSSTSGGSIDSAGIAHTIVVVAFANEEGAGGSESFDGSRAIVGRPNRLDATDRNGRSLAQKMNAAGGSPSKVAEAAWQGSLAAFIELHIEQGPVLDTEGLPIGIVTGVTGQRNVNVTIDGRANHAGTTPMDLRSDALVAAARAILIIENLPSTTGVRVATTGSADVLPNVRNVVPGSVRLGVDIRDLDDGLLDAAVVSLQNELNALATDTGVSIETVVAGSQPSVPADAALMDVLEAAADSCGQPSRRMVSGAGHDAQVMADLGPMGMLFVPSRDGVSHSPREHTDSKFLVAGAEVLLEAVRQLDAIGQLDTGDSP